jgi:2,5-furandicarboxylate decarboxylase 1
VKSEADVLKEMTDLIREKPRTWHEILEHFSGQPYPVVYRAFGQLRPKLGRMADERPSYPYTFADTNFVYSDAKNAASKTARSVGA